MWNSPRRRSRKGKRYSIEDIAVLAYPLEPILVGLELNSPTTMFCEPMIRSMQKGEFIFALYTALQALLEDIPIPEGGHPGHQEAMVFELLNDTYHSVLDELEDFEAGDSARRAAWTSFVRNCGPSVRKSRPEDGYLYPLKRRLNIAPPNCFKDFTAATWEDILLGRRGLWGEFFSDEDWRLELLLDLPDADEVEMVRPLEIDAKAIERLPHTPSRAEKYMAEYYIRYVIWKGEVTAGR